MRILFLLSVSTPMVAYGASSDLPIIDAHSQFDDDVPAARVLEYAARAGVTQVLLSARRRVTPAQVVALASSHSACIVPSVRTKGRAFMDNRPGYRAMLDQQLREPAFRAMGEILLVHAPKGSRAHGVDVAAEAPQVKETIQRAMARGWPVVLHYEFRWLARSKGADARARRLAELKSLVSRHPEQKFALIHMGQLDASDVADLLGAHPNLLFLTSHANPIVTRASEQPWTNMFSDGEIASEWKALLLRYPDRFVLALDNVWPEHWSETYVQQVALWRKALARLPDDVAHSVAHRNAERLWKLPPAVAGGGCMALPPSGAN